MRWSLFALLPALACQTPRQDCPSAVSNDRPKVAAPSTRTDAPAEAAAKQAAATNAPPAKSPPPPPLRSGNQVEMPTQLEEINRWATAAGVRDSLLDWVAAGLATENKSTRVDIDYVGVESPMTAVATVTLDGYLDDSVRGERFVLKFSRKACDTCASGMSGWWLWEMDVTRRCQKGRGHETFAKGRCL